MQRGQRNAQARKAAGAHRAHHAGKVAVADARFGQQRVDALTFDLWQVGDADTGVDLRLRSLGGGYRAETPVSLSAAATDTRATAKEN